MFFIFLLKAFFSFNLFRCPYDLLLSMKSMISESSSVFTGRCWWRKGQAIPQAQRTPSYATETGMFIAKHCKSRLGKLSSETFELNKRSKKKLLLSPRHDTTVSLWGSHSSSFLGIWICLAFIESPMMISVSLFTVPSTPLPSGMVQIRCIACVQESQYTSGISVRRCKLAYFLLV